MAAQQVVVLLARVRSSLVTPQESDSIKGRIFVLVKGEVKLSTVGGTSVRVRITMTNWESFYQKTKELPPSPLLVKAMSFATPHGNY
jgi:hypothetical protein